MRLTDRSRVSGGKGKIVVELGRMFIGTPYLAGTLEAKTAEGLIVNWSGFDCFTFLENLVALALFLDQRGRFFRRFESVLCTLRYRDGRATGYASRLHYFSDWMYENQKKRIVKEMTAAIGGAPFKKRIHFMTSHLELYPALKSADERRRLKSIEDKISRRRRFFIPKQALPGLEHKILDGDLIGITTEREGLDVQHVGIAVRIQNRIHLLHASSAEGEVAISEATLYQYLKQGGERSGITVARIF